MSARANRIRSGLPAYNGRGLFSDLNQWSKPCLGWLEVARLNTPTSVYFGTHPTRHLEFGRKTVLAEASRLGLYT